MLFGISWESCSRSGLVLAVEWLSASEVVQKPLNPWGKPRGSGSFELGAGSWSVVRSPETSSGEAGGSGLASSDAESRTLCFACGDH